MQRQSALRFPNNQALYQGERAGEKERERQRERERDRERERERERKRERERLDRQTDRQTDQTDIKKKSPATYCFITNAPLMKIEICQEPLRSISLKMYYKLFLTITSRPRISLSRHFEIWLVLMTKRIQSLTQMLSAAN